MASEVLKTVYRSLELGPSANVVLEEETLDFHEGRGFGLPLLLVEGNVIRFPQDLVLQTNSVQAFGSWVFFVELKTRGSVALASPDLNAARERRKVKARPVAVHHHHATPPIEEDYCP